MNRILDLRGKSLGNDTQPSQERKRDRSTDVDEVDMNLDNTGQPTPRNWRKKIKVEVRDDEQDDLTGRIKRDILETDINTRWDDISGLDDVKETVRESVILPLIIPQFFRGIRRPWRGILLFGPPGTGKTLLARAVATECKTDFFNVTLSAIGSKWMGETEKIVKTIFETARKAGKATIFIDEIDSICSSRSGDSEQEASRRVKAELLVQMDGLCSGKNKGILVLAATNYPWDLDEAIRRRFEKRIYVPMPSLEARASLFRHYLKDVDVAGDIDYERLAKATNGYSASDLANICRDACMMNMRKVLKEHSTEELSRLSKDELEAPVTLRDFVKSLQKIKTSVTTQEVKRLENWKENYQAL